MRYPKTKFILLISLIMLLAACGQNEQLNSSNPQQTEQTDIHDKSDPSSNTPSNSKDQEKTNAKEDDDGVDHSGTTDEKPNINNEEEAEPARPIINDPDHTAVLVNKQYGLPEDYKPDDLVYPDVHFIFSEKIEKRMLRKEAAEALEQMFAGAKEDGIFLGGVSGYRSRATQTALFNRYLERDGEEKAKMYSARPGHSEHETGLAIDVSGSDGKCAAQDCFADTKEAEWLADHAWEYGFIIRYPQGKEHITGYQYEPWHLRYVGKEIAKEIHEQEITLEEYYNAVPVSQ